METHFQNIRKFFIICANNNLRLNAKKAVFFETKVDFLGFEVENGVIRPSKDRVEAIRNRDYPKNRDEAISLFGALGSHRRFIDNFAALALPISQTYRGNFSWTQEASDSVDKLKEIICSEALELALPPSEGASFVLETDASDFALGGVLYNCEKGILGHDHNMDCLKPVAYFSQNLSECQRKYVTMEKELLAGKICFEKWSVYLAYRTFDWISDNSCIKYAQSFKTKNLKIQRWLSEIAGYSYNLIHRKSKRMCISDYLSRSNSRETKINQIKIDKNNLIQLQKADETLGVIYNYVKIDRWPNKFDQKFAGYKRWRDLLVVLETDELVLRDPLGFERICVPESLKNEIIEEYHCSQHTGIDITFKRISDKYFWLNMKKSISDFIRSCHYCQTSKPCNNPNRPPLGKFRTPNAPYEALAFDLIGPLRETDDGNIHILTCIDMFSKRVYAEPLSCKNGQYLLDVFKKILFANPHFPRMINMDNAQEFKPLAAYFKEKGIEPHFSPPRHPQSNGLVENFNRTLKSRLRARCNLENWDKWLYECIHDINSSQHSVVQMSPFAVEFGVQTAHNINDSSYRTYGEKVEIDFENIREKIEAEKDDRVRKFENHKFREYEIGSSILIKNFRCKFPPFLGPMIVTEKSKNGTKYTCVDEETGKTFIRHANDIRVYNSPIREKPKEPEKASEPLEQPDDYFNPNFINDENFENFAPVFLSPNFAPRTSERAFSENPEAFGPSENNEFSESKSEESVVSNDSIVSEKDQISEEEDEILESSNLENEVNLKTVTTVEKSENSKSSDITENSENSDITENSENLEISEGRPADNENEAQVVLDNSENVEILQNSKNVKNSEILQNSEIRESQSSGSSSMEDYVSRLPKPTGIKISINLDSSSDSSGQSVIENQAPRELEISNIGEQNKTLEIETPESTQNDSNSKAESSSSDFQPNSNLDNITETETSMEACAPKLLSYDKLNQSEFINEKKRAREITNNSPSPKKLQIIDSNQFETRENDFHDKQNLQSNSDFNPNSNETLEKFVDDFVREVCREKFRNLAEVRKLDVIGKRQIICGQPFYMRQESDSEDDDKAEMSINIFLENEHNEFFQNIENEFEAIRQNLCYKNGLMLKIGELTKQMLQFIARKFEIEIFEGIKDKKASQIRVEIRDFIHKNFSGWKRSSSGELLFYSTFYVQKTISINKLSRPELKCLAASVNLSKVVYLSKPKLLAEIIDYFSREKPLHPRNSENELIFHPENDL